EPTPTWTTPSFSDRIETPSARASGRPLSVTEERSPTGRWTVALAPTGTVTVIVRVFPLLRQSQPTVPYGVRVDVFAHVMCSVTAGATVMSRYPVSCDGRMPPT